MSASGFRIALIAVVCLMVVYFQQDVNGIRLDAMTEPCFPETPATVALNVTWVESVKLWYYNAQSYLDIYRASSEALKIPVPEIKAADIYYKSCPTIEWTPDRPYCVYSIMGKLVKFPMRPNVNGSSTFYMDYLELGGVTTVPLTDNKSYIFFYACWTDGTSSWGVMSTTPQLDHETMKEIYDFAEKIGFSPDYFSYVRFDGCKDLATVATHLDD